MAALTGAGRCSPLGWSSSQPVPLCVCVCVCVCGCMLTAESKDGPTGSAGRNSSHRIGKDPRGARGVRADYPLRCPEHSGVPARPCPVAMRGSMGRPLFYPRWGRCLHSPQPWWAGFGGRVGWRAGMGSKRACVSWDCLDFWGWNVRPPMDLPRSRGGWVDGRQALRIVQGPRNTEHQR